MIEGRSTELPSRITISQIASSFSMCATLMGAIVQRLAPMSRKAPAKVDDFAQVEAGERVFIVFLFSHYFFIAFRSRAIAMLAFLA